MHNQGVEDEQVNDGEPAVCHHKELAAWWLFSRDNKVFQDSSCRCCGGFFRHGHGLLTGY
jgi:hypothetical protein